MKKLKSKYCKKKLIARWDERTNPARFAGNDNIWDLVFLGLRKENKIKLMRRSGVSREPFSSIFRGKIVETENGSEIRGFFTKSIFDYIMVGAVLLCVCFIYLSVRQRETSLTAVNVIAFISIVCAFFLLHTRKKTKKLYLDFLSDIL